jgi:hypothetical protein
MGQALRPALLFRLVLRENEVEIVPTTRILVKSRLRQWCYPNLRRMEIRLEIGLVVSHNIRQKRLRKGAVLGFSFSFHAQTLASGNTRPMLAETRKVFIKTK